MRAVPTRKPSAPAAFARAIASAVCIPDSAMRTQPDGISPTRLSRRETSVEKFLRLRQLTPTTFAPHATARDGTGDFAGVVGLDERVESESVRKPEQVL